MPHPHLRPVPKNGTFEAKLRHLYEGILRVLGLPEPVEDERMFLPGGYAPADLEKHRIWVCPLFEPTLEWLYTQDLSPSRSLADLPSCVDLPDAPFAWAGYRRAGSHEATERA